MFFIKYLEIKRLKINAGFKKDFKNFCYIPKIIMIYLYTNYTKYSFFSSYRGLEELCQLRGLAIDHSTFQR